MKITGEPKLAGLLVPVFALRREHESDLGIGDTLAVRDAIQFCRRNSIAVLQTLPINETSGDNSPYNAISSMALEPSLIAMTPEMVPSLEAHVIADIVESEHFDASGEYVDYPAVKRIKLLMMRAAFHEFVKRADSDKLTREFEGFQSTNADWLAPYTVFRCLMDENFGNSRWTDWQEELQTYAGALTWIEVHKDGDRLKETISFWAFVQWVADRQWRDLREFADANEVRLMGDIPFGVSRYSVDVWHKRELFDLDWSGGAPPEPVFHTDEFTKNWGQNWGIPLYRWSEHKKDDFSWWTIRVKRLLEHFHDFRIDHVLGFFRIYAFPWIPERNEEFVELTEVQASKLTGGKMPKFLPRADQPAVNARLNKVQGEEILKAICDAADSGYIVAEDLGLVIPEYLRPVLHRLGMAGFAIPIFERIEQTREFKPIADLHPLSLATYATHDHEPIASVYEALVERWTGPDGEEGWLEIKRLMKLLKWPVGDSLPPPPRQFDDALHQAFIEALVESPCWLVVLMITDLFGSKLRFNQPGLSGASCWTQRLDQTLAGYESDPVTAVKIERFKESIEKSGRRAVKAGSAASG
ncbi:MAG: 4-alpha-glucanotransferase [Candidatus Obscuribacterales bacterium]|nr:4-alpha-glucanotransferase [Candidatus Obscuribacterales bacterium]